MIIDIDIETNTDTDTVMSHRYRYIEDGVYRVGERRWCFMFDCGVYPYVFMFMFIAVCVYGCYCMNLGMRVDWCIALIDNLNADSR
jgi:hypothetical protein